MLKEAISDTNVPAPPEEDESGHYRKQRYGKRRHHKRRGRAGLNKESYTSPLENSHILLRLFSRGIFLCYKKIILFHKRKVWIVFFLCLLMILCLIGRLIYLMGFRSDYYYEKAEDLHERERDIKAARGEIVDAKGKVLAANKTVCTISVIHSQIKDPEKMISLLTEKLGISEETVRKRVEKVSSIERIKTNVKNGGIGGGDVVL